MKCVTLDGRNYDGMLEGIRVYYDGMSASKAREKGIKAALCKIYHGEKVDVVYVDESNTESPWYKKLRNYWNKLRKEEVLA